MQGKSFFPVCLRDGRHRVPFLDPRGVDEHTHCACVTFEKRRPVWIPPFGQSPQFVWTFTTPPPVFIPVCVYSGLLTQGSPAIEVLFFKNAIFFQTVKRSRGERD